MVTSGPAAVTERHWTSSLCWCRTARIMTKMAVRIICREKWNQKAKDISTTVSAVKRGGGDRPLVCQASPLWMQHSERSDFSPSSDQAQRWQWIIFAWLYATTTSFQLRLCFSNNDNKKKPDDHDMLDESKTFFLVWLNHGSYGRPI